MWGTAKFSIQNKITDGRMRGTSSKDGFARQGPGQYFTISWASCKKIKFMNFPLISVKFGWLKFLLSHVHGLDGIENCIWQVFEWQGFPFKRPKKNCQLTTSLPVSLMHRKWTNMWYFLMPTAESVSLAKNQKSATRNPWWLRKLDLSQAILNIIDLILRGGGGKKVIWLSYK